MTTTAKHSTTPWKLGYTNEGMANIDSADGQWAGLAQVVVQMDGDEKPHPEGTANLNLILTAVNAHAQWGEVERVRNRLSLYMPEQLKELDEELASDISWAIHALNLALERSRG